jgi:5'(3')-deoxyribonucleotidase
VKTLLLDADGVVFDFIGAFMRVAQRVTGKRYERAQVTDWNITKALGISPEEERRIYDHIRQPGFAFKEIAPYLGAVEGVQYLMKRAEVYFVTSPIRSTRDEQAAWNSPFSVEDPHVLTWMHDREHALMKHFGIDEHHVVHTSAKHLVAGNVFVDDKPANVRRWQEHNAGLGMLWHQEYNRGAVLPRVFDWEGVAAALESHSTDALV